jgi:hypothetical protein
MRAINHALTGAVIGLAVSEPVVAIPLAVLSHYICDVIPHYGRGLTQAQELRSDFFRNLIYIDAVLCLGLVVILGVARPVHWPLAVACAFAAAAPDFLSINRYIRVRYNRSWRPGRYSRFAAGIQWFERPIGAVVETAWFVACIVLLMPFLR